MCVKFQGQLSESSFNIILVLGIELDHVALWHVPGPVKTF